MQLDVEVSPPAKLHADGQLDFLGGNRVNAQREAPMGEFSFSVAWLLYLYSLSDSHSQCRTLLFVMTYALLTDRGQTNSNPKEVLIFRDIAFEEFMSIF